MAGESGHFGLRDRPSTPAVRPFELPPRMQPMLDRAKTDLAEPFRGITHHNGIVPGLFATENTGIALASLIEAARYLIAALPAAHREETSCPVADEPTRRRSSIRASLT